MNIAILMGSVPVCDFSKFRIAIEFQSFKIRMSLTILIFKDHKQHRFSFLYYSWEAISIVIFQNSESLWIFKFLKFEWRYRFLFFKITSGIDSHFLIIHGMRYRLWFLKIQNRYWFFKFLKFKCCYRFLIFKITSGMDSHFLIIHGKQYQLWFIKIQNRYRFSNF